VLKERHEAVDHAVGEMFDDGLVTTAGAVRPTRRAGPPGSISPASTRSHRPNWALKTAQIHAWAVASVFASGASLIQRSMMSARSFSLSRPQRPCVSSVLNRGHGGAARAPGGDHRSP